MAGPWSRPLPHERGAHGRRCPCSARRSPWERRLDSMGQYTAWRRNFIVYAILALFLDSSRSVHRNLVCGKLVHTFSSSFFQPFWYNGHGRITDVQKLGRIVRWDGSASQIPLFRGRTRYAGEDHASLCRLPKWFVDGGREKVLEVTPPHPFRTLWYQREGWGGGKCKESKKSL